jgi:hypothetical protein
MWNLTKSKSILGFILLTVMVMVLLISAVAQAWITYPAAGIFASFVLLGASIAIYLEGKGLISQDITGAKFSHLIFEFLAVVLGGIGTYYLAYFIGLGAVVASSLIAIVADMLVPEYGVPAYCGSFVGMSSNILFINHSEVALASAFAGLVYVLTRDIFAGFGGKLGTIAFIGASITTFSLGREFLLVPIADWKTNLWVLVIALIATPLTFYLNCYRGYGPVLASGVVGLIAGLILPVLFPQNGYMLAVVVICASFTGMSNTNRCPIFWHIFIAGLFTGMLFIFTTPLLGGAGGKLGTIAFASTISTCGLTQFIRRVYGKKAH